MSDSAVRGKENLWNTGVGGCVPITTRNTTMTPWIRLRQDQSKPNRWFLTPDYRAGAQGIELPPGTNTGARGNKPQPGGESWCPPPVSIKYHDQKQLKEETMHATYSSRELESPWQRRPGQQPEPEASRPHFIHTQEMARSRSHKRWHEVTNPQRPPPVRHFLHQGCIS